MRSFAEHNPLSVALYFAAVSGIAMFGTDPVIISLSLLGAVFFYLARNGVRQAEFHLFAVLIFAVTSLINPLVSHNGRTVLFVMNNNPVTLEALVYGLVTAAMIAAVLYWFRSFTQIMTDEKLLYIFGFLSPKLALILSMALRFVPLYTVQAKKVRQTQKALGLYKADNIIDSFKGELGIFSIMVTWGLENGIITADSMAARGYGIGKRSRYSVFCFKPGDIILLTATAILFSLTVIGMYGNAVNYYPAIVIKQPTAAVIAGYISYGLLVFLPAAIDLKERLKWKYLRSKI